MTFRKPPKDTILAVVEVIRTERISPNFMRITVGGDALRGLENYGFDHWFRLFLPKEEGETSFNLPDRADMVGYLKYLRMPEATRPYLRNYTVREFRPDDLELDIDFAVHGDDGIATRWATRTSTGDTVALIDQGIGYEWPENTEHHVLVADETGLPAVAGILRDLPREAVGTAMIEIPHADDAQDVSAPDGFDVRWLVRDTGARPGQLALDSLLAWQPPTSAVSAYLVGEQALATGARRDLVAKGIAKKSITFSGYWRLGADPH